ncbi:hypothetical protein B0H14DRAFT_3157767 [Mycena olivaceomarginata]|nr:hypothetical protein B0H14DRAFT_3157767 [Mycena olivaceomarginata]
MEALARWVALCSVLAFVWAEISLHPPSGAARTPCFSDAQPQVCSSQKPCICDVNVGKDTRHDSAPLAIGARYEGAQKLTASKVRQAKAEETRREAERLEAMTAAQRRNVELLQNFGDAFDDDDRYEQDILHGRTAVDISHAGEALPPDEADAADAALMAGLRRRPGARYRDTRTRKNRTQQQTAAFEAQLERMADAYLEFSLAIADEGLMASPRVPENADVQETRDLLVVDMFSASHEDLKMIGADAYIASACVRQGWMPCAAYFPTVVITIRALEVYRVARLRCPRLGIQAFVRALCDIHGVAPRPWLGTQFSVAFDVYLAVRARVDKRVHVALGRDTPDWRLKNACPACLYKLEGEPHLKFPLLCTFDGNNSLSRFWAREREVSLADGTTAPGASKELRDERVAPGDYYMLRDDVNKWEKDGVLDVLKSFSLDAEDGDDDIVCSDRWQNMKEEVTARSYGMYDETRLLPRALQTRVRPQSGGYGEKRGIVSLFNIPCTPTTC